MLNKDDRELLMSAYMQDQKIWDDRVSSLKREYSRWEQIMKDSHKNLDTNEKMLIKATSADTVGGSVLKLLHITSENDKRIEQLRERSAILRGHYNTSYSHCAQLNEELRVVIDNPPPVDQWSLAMLGNNLFCAVK